MLTDPCSISKAEGKKIIRGQYTARLNEYTEPIRSKLQSNFNFVNDLSTRLLLKGRRMFPTHISRLPENVLTPEVNQLVLALEDDWHGMIPLLADKFYEDGHDEYAEACLLQQKLISHLIYPGREKDEDRLLELDDKGIHCPRVMQVVEFNKVYFHYTLVPPGVFYVGTDRIPCRISSNNWVATFNITQKQWLALRDTNPASNQSDLENPVERVSWNDIRDYCRDLNAKEDFGMDMVSEALWEYSARGGIYRKFPWGDDVEKVKEYCWYAENSGGHTQPVGRLRPNCFGIYDMLGNTWEWVKDTYTENFFRLEYEKLPEEKRVKQDCTDNFTQLLRVNSRAFISDQKKRAAYAGVK